MEAPAAAGELPLPLLPDTNDPELDMFQYTPLPQRSCTRLLKILPGSTDQLECSLRTIDLGWVEDNVGGKGQSPPYNALSYTWGSPATAQDLGAERGFPILCNGKTLLVTSNLYDALLHLRKSQYTEPPASVWADRVTGAMAAAELFPDSAPDTQKRIWPTGLWKKQQFLWIDAICIDQANQTEKTEQVMLMGDIYTTAVSVLVWLGKSDAATEKALDVISHLASVPRECYGRLRSHHISDPESYPELGIPWIPREYWEAFAALMQRRWFDRAWVVQEVALSRYLAVLCGPHEISWANLVKSSNFVMESQWYYPLNDFPLAQKGPGGVHSMTRYSFGAAAMLLSNIRDDLYHGQGRFLGLDLAPSLEALMLLARPKDAGDPRDKVYALLGIVHNSSPATNLRQHKRIMTPDYTTSIRDVYLEATLLILKGTGDLRILASVEDASCRKVGGLPSWVADWSALNWPPPLIPGVRGSGHELKWCASGASVKSVLRWTDPSTRHGANGCLLTFEAAHFDTITGYADTHENLVSSHMWITFLIMAIKSGPRYPTGEGLTEALWRTLVTDTFNDQHPAPVEVALRFRDFFLMQLQITVWAAEKARNTKDPKVNDFIRLLMATRAALRDLAQMDPSGVLSDLDQMDARLTILQKQRILRGPYPKDFNDILDGYFEYLHGGWDQVYGGRRLFRTSKKYLGLGAQSLRVGDTIWITPNARVPLLLRNMPCGHFQFVSEAYVHGIMHGEAVESSAESMKFEQVVVE